MKWIVEFVANDKTEVEEYTSRDMAKENFKVGRKLFMNLATMTPDLKVSGTLTEINQNGQSNIISSFAN